MQEVVVSNILEGNSLDALPDADHESWIADYRHFSGKALYWPDARRVTFVSHWPLDLLGSMTPDFVLPGQEREVLCVPMKGYALCEDFLADDAAMERLVARLDPRDAVALLSWVASPGLGRLAKALCDRGFQVSPTPEQIERTAEIERTLRERQPMVALLNDVPEVRVLRPATTCLDGWADVRAFLESHPLGNGWVVKGRDSVGGSGVMMIDTEVERARVAASEAPCRSADEKSFYLFMNAPYVIEELIGDRHTNLSPTLDVHVSDTATTFVAAGWQILQGGAGYVGVLTGPKVAVPPPEVMAASIAVGEALRALGYTGYCNLDYIVTTDGRWAMMEMNLRRSSPIDHFHSVARLPTPMADAVAASLDYVTPDGATRLVAAAQHPGSGVTVSRRLGDPVSGQQWVGLMLRATSPAALLAVCERADHEGDDNLRELLERMVADRA